MNNKKIIIDQDKCIGCNTCPLIDPDTFELDTTTYKACVKQQPKDNQISVKTTSAIESCPVQCISVVED